MATRVAKKTPAKRTAKATAYQMYVDGAFVSAKNGKTFDVFDPSTEQPMADVPGRRGRRRGSRGAGGEAGVLRRMADDDRAGPRPHPVPDRRADPRAPRRAGRDRDLNSGKPIAESEYDMDDAATCFEYYGGLATKIHGEVLAGAGQRAVPGPARADRRGRPDHPVELPAADGGLEGRAGARRGLHRRCSSRPSRPRSACSSWPRIFEAVGMPAGRGQRRHRRRSRRGRRRSSPIPMSTRSRSPAAPRSASRSCGPRRTRSSGSPWSWAASRPTSSSPTPTSRRRSTARCSACSSTRARCAPRAAACWCRRTSTRRSSTRSRPRPRPSSSARASIATTKMGPLVSAEQRERVVRYLEIGRKEAKLAAGGGTPEAATQRGWYVEPTIFYDVDNRREDRAGGDLRPGHVRDSLQGRGRGASHRQRHAIRPGRGGVEPRHLQGLPRGQGARGRHRLGQPHAAHLRRGAVGRLQESPASAASWATGASRSTCETKQVYINLDEKPIGWY